jgi:hypothetical protein
MATITSNPTSNTTPDQGGTLAVSGISNTGHSSTVAAASASAPGGFGSDSDSQSKSARWSAFQSVSGLIREIRLKLEWTASGEASANDGGGGGIASASCNFSIEYTLNGGSSWIPIVSDGAVAGGGGSDSFTNNNSASILLSVGQNISQIQVRDFMDAFASANGGEFTGASADADVTVTISGIRLEVITQDQTHLLVMM